MDEGISKDLAKHWWLHCIACSEASITTQKRGFGIEEPAYEQALHAFSGGFMHLGHACGLLTGAALAAGFLYLARFDDDDNRSAAALDIIRVVLILVNIDAVPQRLAVYVSLFADGNGG